jgi:hypothetical protein
LKRFLWLSRGVMGVMAAMPSFADGRAFAPRSVPQSIRFLAVSIARASLACSIRAPSGNVCRRALLVSHHHAGD